MFSHEVPQISLPAASLRFALRKRCCGVRRAILGLEAISRSIGKAKLISAVTDGLCGGELGSMNSHVWAV